MTSEPPVLTVQGLRVHDRKTGALIVDGFDLALGEGELVALVGPSGSGKSTVANAMIGLLPPGLETIGGSCTIEGVNMLNATQLQLRRVRGRALAYLPQDPMAALNPVLSCGCQVEEPLRLHTKMDARQRRDAVLDLLGKMGLSDPRRIYGAFPSDISGGQRQRVMMAMATILEPKVLIADEPTTALDPDTAVRIMLLYEQLRTRHGSAVLMISHDRGLVRANATRVIGMSLGRVEPWVDNRTETTGARLRIQPSKPHPLIAEEAAKIVDVTKRYNYHSTAKGKTAAPPVLDRVSLDLRRSEVVGLLGASGSGKTTLGRCIAGLVAPDQGQVLVNGSPTQARTRRRAPHPVQIVYQSPYSSLNPVMSVGESVAEGSRAAGEASFVRLERAARSLELVGLPRTYLARRPAALSGGERQRVVIARALQANPAVLIADEPTASLDEASKWQILELLGRLAKQSGLAVLLISHDIAIVNRACDRVFCLAEGRLKDVSGDLSLASTEYSGNEPWKD